MRGRLEPKDTVERFWGLKFIGFPNLSDETPKPAMRINHTKVITLPLPHSSSGQTVPSLYFSSHSNESSS